MDFNMYLASTAETHIFVYPTLAKMQPPAEVSHFSYRSFSSLKNAKMEH